MNNVPYTEKKQHKDIKGLRISLSVILGIIAACSFMCFIEFRAFRMALSSDLIAESISNINILDMKMEGLNGFVDIDNADSDATVSEYVAETIANTAADKFGYNISKESVEEILEDEDFREDFGELTQDTIGSYLEGELDSDELADDVRKLVKNNRDKIEEISGVEVTDSLLDDIHDTIEKTDINIGGNNSVQQEISDNLSFIKNIIPGYMVYVFLGVGVACIMGILLLNMFKLATGLRTSGIVCLVVGVLEGFVALFIKGAPKLLVSIIDEVTAAGGTLNGFMDSAFGTIIMSYVNSIVKSIMIPSVAFGTFGLACIIASIIISVVSRKKY